MRSVAVALLMLLSCTAALAQRWNYFYFNGSTQMKGELALERSGQDELKLRYFFNVANPDVCFRSPLSVKLESFNNMLLVTPIQVVGDCLESRIALPMANATGFRQVRGQGGRWVRDGLDRGITLIGPMAPWLQETIARSPAPSDAAALAARETPRPVGSATLTAAPAPSAPSPPSVPSTVPAATPPATAQAAPPAAPATTAQTVAALQPPAPRTEPPKAQSKLRVRALVIGNGSYSSFGKLPNPRNDAEAMAAKFRSMGIEVELVLDADRDTFVKALNDYSSRAVGSDINILYYAGHGVQVDGVNYLVPVNMRADGITAGYIKLSGISLNAALDYMPSSTRLVFLDACRDNPASRSLSTSRGAGTAGLAPVNTSSGTLIAYATKDGATAEDGQGRHSPYTTALLEHLGRPDDIAVVLRRVRQTVMKLTSNRQEPWEYGSLVGDQLVLSQTSR
ncbi:MAG: caspase family protein [Bdellovibrionales bacterium]|nr:caspase family protein [Ramlibacter sp.]